MFDFIFRKKKGESGNIDVDIKAKSRGDVTDDIKSEAKNSANSAYRTVLREKIKDDLLERYLPECDFNRLSWANNHLRERFLIDAIIDEMIDQLGLMNDIE